jgi:GNAT superfamily N-acetyltransferase
VASGTDRSLRIRSFADADVPAAAALLAERQSRWRTRRLELPNAYTVANRSEPLLRALLERDGAFGVGLEAEGELSGFLIGYPRPEPIWGRACWSPLEGSVLASWVPAEAMRDLYAVWSEHYVKQGYFRHYVHAASDDADLMAAWFRTGFSQMQAHALRSLALEANPPPGVRLRRAEPSDLNDLEPLLPLIALQLMRPPAYAFRPHTDRATYRDAWAAELGDATAHHLLAEEDGRVLALASFHPADPGPMVPHGAWELAVAMTSPDERGRGLMRALVAAGFTAARDAGATHCTTDWRTASLPTHRTWVALGWRPTHYRLHRHIDERIEQQSDGGPH